jgi:hypothetical protein
VSFEARLAALLAERGGERSAAGLAVAVGHPPRRHATWLPASLTEEPASASAFHAPALGPGGVTACALCASEEEHLAEQLVFAALEIVAGAAAAGP